VDLMTTIEAALSWAGRGLQRTAERRQARRRVAAGSVLVQLWNLLLTVGGLGAFTVAAWGVAWQLGAAVGGVCLFALRTLVDWRSDART
jgi:hypothetical protein